MKLLRRMVLGATFAGAMVACSLGALAQTQTQQNLWPAKPQFADANGAPLSGGTASFYVPNTLTPKTTYQDPFGSVSNPTSVPLDSAGRAFIYGNGLYRMILQDSGGNTIYDGLTGASFAGTVASGHVLGNSTGSPAPPADTTLTSLFDVAYCATQAVFLGRGASAWGCFTGVYVPEMFGTVGTADDTATIQAALTAIGNAGGGALLLPRNGGYIIQGVTVPANVEIRGPGTLVQFATSNQNGFVTLSGNNSGIRRVQLQGNASAPAGSGVVIGAVGNVWIEDCIITNFPVAGIASTSVNANTVRITGNQFVGNHSWGILMSVGTGHNMNSIWIRGNYVTGTVAGQGIFLDGSASGATLADVIVSNNEVTNNGSGNNAGGGIWVFHAFPLHITSNNTVSNNGDNIQVNGSIDFVVSDNVASLATGPVAAPNSAGISIGGNSAAGAISSNVVDQNTGAGILVTTGLPAGSPSYITISGNTTTNNNQSTAQPFGGIEVDPLGGSGAPAFITIAGNTSLDNQGGVTQAYAVRVSGSLTSATDVTVTGNKLNRSRLTNLSLAGSTPNLVITGNPGYNPVGAASVTPGASVWTYTAGTSPETLTVSASGGISAATIGGVSVLPAAIGNNVTWSVPLAPNQAVVITYGGVATAATIKY